jgi:hypothetical protein
MEGRLVAQTFERLLSQETLDPEEMENIRKALRFAEEVVDGLGFCMSESPDLLSQWRGYADDGQGFSIGFNSDYLVELTKSREGNEDRSSLGKVLYEPTEHETALRPRYQEIKELIDSGRLKMPRFGLISWPGEEEVKRMGDQHSKSLNNLFLRAVMTYPAAYMLKSKAFAEEAEWRLVSYLSRVTDDSAMFRAVGNRLVPYREFKLKQLMNKSIAEVYVGPKNITPDFVIEKFLALNGFPDVSVKRSAATYR